MKLNYKNEKKYARRHKKSEKIGVMSGMIVFGVIAETDDMSKKF